MAEDPQHRQLLEHAATAREDQAVADQLQGALETLIEKVPDDAVVVADLPQCAAFRRLLYELRQALAPLVAAADKGDPPPAGFDPARALALIPQWQVLRTAFHRDYRKHKDYLEKLALRIYR